MRTLFIVPMLVAIVLTGCKAPEPLDINVACRTRVTTLNHAAHKSVSINDSTIDMCRGRTLTINVVPRVNMNGARSKPGTQNPGAGWLDESAEDGQKIVIEVPQNVEINSEFKYTLTVDGVGSLDPIIRIIN